MVLNLCHLWKNKYLVW